jgi:hypothetical protein
MMTDGSGLRCVEFARLSVPDGCWLKTSSGFCQRVMFEETSLEVFSETWPRSGMVTSSGIACQLEPLPAHPTSEIEYGSWPPPVSMIDPSSLETRTLAGEMPDPRLEMFPTPNASDNRDRGNLSHPSIQRRKRIGKQIGLSMMVSPVSGALSADWVELLMGYPLGHTNVEDGSAESPESRPCEGGSPAA